MDPNPTRKPRFPSSRNASNLAIGVAILACLVSAACAGTISQQRNSGVPSTAFPVVFSSAVSYRVALRELVDLGLQPAVFCGFKSDLEAGHVIVNLRWQPAGQTDTFEREHRIFVTRTLATAPDWEHLLSNIPGVQANRAQHEVYCPDAGAGEGARADAGGGPRVLTEQEIQPPVYRRVAFATSTSYNQALYELSDLGVRLANPCFESARSAAESHGSPAPEWKPVGQYDAFMTGHSLVIAPTALVTPVDWQQRVHALAGVITVDPISADAC